MTLLDGRKWMAGSAAAVVTLGGAAWVWHARQPVAMVYSPAGYGGVVPAARGSQKPGAGSQKGEPASQAPSPAALLAPAEREYDAGRYLEAEKTAQEVIDRTPAAAKPAQRFPAVRARELMAYSAARRNDLTLARRLFAVMKVEAAKLPDGGKIAPRMGDDPEPALTEDAAYQHAVCTSALGDKKGAEAEYVRFMKDYPESPLLQACIKRIARLHGGDIPKEDEAVWKESMTIATARAKERQREQSLCGPECLARVLALTTETERRRDGTEKEPELVPDHQGTKALSGEPKAWGPGPGTKEEQKVQTRVGAPLVGARSIVGAPLVGARSIVGAPLVGARRSGAPLAAPGYQERPPAPNNGGVYSPRVTSRAEVKQTGTESVEALAREMGTDERGTTLEALAETARRHGLRAQGMKVTMEGLIRQRTPLIALISPGHYVIVESASKESVTCWDPTGPASGTVRTCATDEWQKIWSGVVLAF